MSFLNPIFLAGLAAAALPILIHLFSRRRTREVRFPSLEFLQEVSRKKIRRLQLRQILLLALRILIIAFFALAMGRPALRTSGGALGRGSTTVAIVLDNSFSMAARDPEADGPGSYSNPAAGSTAASPGSASAGFDAGAPSASAAASAVPEEGTVWQAAKRRAGEIVSMLREGDRAFLVLAASPVTVPYQTPIADLGLLRQEVDRAGVEATRADLPLAIERAAELLAQARTLNREIFVLSDFQQADVEELRHHAGGLAGRPAGAPADSPRRDADRGRAVAEGADSLQTGARAGAGAIALAEGIRVYLVPLRSLPVDNAAIERARLESAGTGAEAGARLTVTVVNPGSEPLTDRVVRATAAGGAGEEVESDALGEAFVSAPPGGRGESSLLLRRLPASGAVRVSLAPDALPWDNQAYLVTEQPGIRRVLIVSGGETPASDPAARYLALALDPTGGHEFFQPEILGPDDRALTVPIRADAVVLLDLPRLPAPALEQLERYRADGGGILIVLGDRVDPRSYNEDLLPRLGGLELTGLQGTLDDPTTYFRLRVTDPGHPIFEGFSTTSGGSLTSARFLRVLDSKPGPGSRILAEFSGGRPALVETGSTLVFTSSFDGRWNDLPTSAAFVPLVHRMIQRLAQGGSSADRVLAGTAAERAFADEEVGTRDTSLLDPNGNRLPLERSSREGKTWLKTPELRLPGIYRIVRDDGAKLAVLAVNLDTKESNLAVAPASTLPSLFGPDATVLQPKGAIDRALLEGRYGREIWPMLLIAVLGLMIVESLLGRGRILP